MFYQNKICSELCNSILFNKFATQRNLKSFHTRFHDTQNNGVTRRCNNLDSLASALNFFAASYPHYYIRFLINLLMQRSKYIKDKVSSLFFFIHTNNFHAEQNNKFIKKEVVYVL